MWILPFVCLCNVYLLSVCLWLARRWEGVLLCTSCADWKGVSIVLCILLVLMVVGLFVFESVSVSWSCRAGCTSAVGCRLKGSFHSWGEMREQAATTAASTAFDPAHNHTTPHLQPIQIFVFVFVFQIHQCLTQIFEKQPPAHPWIQILTKIVLKNRFPPTEGTPSMGLYLELTPSPF